MTSVSWGGWALLAVAIASLLSIDLFAHRRDAPQSRQSALGWSAFWIAAALVFGAGVTLTLGPERGEEFFAAWLLEKTLSVDNLLLFLVIFHALGLGENDQRRVLSWGILGAVVTRGVFVALGSAALARWHGLVYVLGALLVVLGLKTLRPPGEHGEGLRLLGWLRRHLPVTEEHLLVEPLRGARAAIALPGARRRADRPALPAPRAGGGALLRRAQADHQPLAARAGGRLAGGDRDDARGRRRLEPAGGPPRCASSWSRRGSTRSTFAELSGRALGLISAPGRS